MKVSCGRLPIPSKKRRHPLTVCIAAICMWNGHEMVVCTSDRMLTAGDIEYEPPRRKIFHFTQHVVALWSGDTAPLIEIARDTYLEIGVHQTTPLTVDSIAQTFARHFSSYRRRQAERTILAPLGLDASSFITRQREMAPEFVRDITEALERHDVDGEAIITGVDVTGAHIFQVTDPGQTVMHSGIGFASIGIGSRHAESQFMFRGYTRDWSYEKATYLSYAAKRRAETAPGVGRETDMSFIGPYPGVWKPILPEHAAELREAYDEVEGGIHKLEDQALGRIEKFLKDLEDRVRQERQQQTGDIHGQKTGESGEPKKETGDGTDKDGAGNPDPNAP